MADDGSNKSGQVGHDHAPVVFSLQHEHAENQQSILHEEREKHRRRAERFGAQYVDPGRVRKDFGIMMEARKERLKASHGFTTGDIDLFSREERDKRTARAARFQLSAPLAPSLDRYRPDEELEARARRAAKFGVPYQPTNAVLMDMDLYEQRREVGADVERRPEAIYLYGVDVMSTKDVLSYFSDYGPVFVEWLDDSSCNVLFGDANSAKRAVVGRGTPLPPQVVTGPPQEQQQQQEAQQEMQDPPQQAAAVVRYQPELPIPDNLADVANLPYVWHKAEDFIKDGTPVSLVFRMATVVDVRDMAAPKRTRELWKAGGVAGGGRGRGGRQQWRGGKRPFRRQEGGEGDEGTTDMDVDGDGPGDGSGVDNGDGDMPMKRQRGARGGQRLQMKQMKPALNPYGGAGLLQGAALLPATGHVLDYTELEDEAPPRGGEDGEGCGKAVKQGMGPGWEEGGRRGGRRGRGGRREGAQVGDLRTVLQARRMAAMGAQRHGGTGGEDGEGQEGDGYAGEAEGAGEGEAALAAGEGQQSGGEEGEARGDGGGAGEGLEGDGPGEMDH